MQHLAGEALAMHAREHVVLAANFTLHDGAMLNIAVVLAVHDHAEAAVLGRHLGLGIRAHGHDALNLVHRAGFHSSLGLWLLQTGTLAVLGSARDDYPRL